MLYFIRQEAGLLANPLVVALAVALVGAIFSLRRHFRAANVLFGAAALLAYAGSTPAVGDLLIAPLENRYPPLHALPASVSNMVVLGSGFIPHGDIPITAALDPDGLSRIVEAVRLARRLPGARLILSGGAPEGEPAPARGYEILAQDLGVGKESITVIDKPLNTEAEALALAPIVRKELFLLVTSAYHMPRAVTLMRRHGLNPIPAPTGQSARWSWNWTFWLPGSSGLRNSERALHEYLGLAALAMRFE